MPPPPPEPLGVQIRRDTAGDLVVALRYAYSDRPPSQKQCTSMIRDLLHQALASLDVGRASVSFTAFREGAVRRLRTNEVRLSPPPR